MSAVASLETSFVSGRYVVVRERAHWTRDGKELSQTSLGVYEIEDARVRRVWYYPSAD